MGYRVNLFQNSMSMHAFRQKYQNQEKFIGFCRECPNYGTVWSCPPLPFSVEQYLYPYRHVYVVCARLDLDEETRRAADTAEKVKTIGWEIIVEAKRNLEDALRTWEELVPGSVSLSSGGCNRCSRCSRGEGHPCRDEMAMRYSLDAFGFDLSAITRDMFQIEIQWCHGALPEYFTLIHALLAQEPYADDLPLPDTAFWRKSAISSA